MFLLHLGGVCGESVGEDRELFVPAVGDAVAAAAHLGTDKVGVGGRRRLAALAKTLRSVSA